MDLRLNITLGEKYKSQRQKARVITEDWVSNNFKCPFCNGRLKSLPNNTKCSDFRCTKCNEKFELKSKKGKFLATLNGAEYKTTLEKVASNENPHWILLGHDGLNVTELILIPKYFIYDEMIIPRKPLGEEARRAGWQGCILDLKKIPNFGKIKYIKDSQIVDDKIINYRLKQAEYFKNKNFKEKGWKLEILSYIDCLPENIFTYNQIKKYIPALEKSHPSNNHIDKKISQILQQLRDSKYVEFLDNNGLYMKLF